MVILPDGEYVAYSSRVWPIIQSQTLGRQRRQTRQQGGAEQPASQPLLATAVGNIRFCDSDSAAVLMVGEHSSALSSRGPTAQDWLIHVYIGLLSLASRALLVDGVAYDQLHDHV